MSSYFQKLKHAFASYLVLQRIMELFSKMASSKDETQIFPINEIKLAERDVQFIREHSIFMPGGGLARFAIKLNKTS